MDLNVEEQNKIYIRDSKINIDNALNNNDYKKAFLLLIIVLERLNENDKIEFINYYIKKVNNPFNEYLNSHVNLRRLNCKKK